MLRNNVTMDQKYIGYSMLSRTRKLHILLHFYSSDAAQSVCSSIICTIKSLIGALRAAKGNSRHEGKSMWLCSSVNPVLMVLLMLLCCLPFVTKGQPPPIKTLTSYAWLAAAVCCNVMKPHEQKSLSAEVVFWCHRA